MRSVCGGATLRSHVKAAFLSNICLALIAAFVGVMCFYQLDVQATSTQGNVYRSGDPESDRVSLLFNVYWGTDEVYRILDILDKYEVKSTFFVGGCWADDNNACVKEILSRGHELGSHGYFHKDHESLSYAENLAEMQHCQDLISLMTGYEMKLFAPPSGAYGNDTLQAAADMGYKVILWSRDTVDWRDKDSSLIFNRATKNISNGDLVLMHPTKDTLKALDDIITEIMSKGLMLVTVSENLA